MNDVTAEFVAASIEAFGRKLFAKVEIFSQKIPEKHEGSKYRTAILGFTRQINKLEKKHQGEVVDIAKQISSLHGKGWEEKPEIVRLWHDFAEALTAFSEHPSKKVATVIISEDNRLQSYGVNRIPPGMIKRPEHFIRGLRSSYIICSERMAFINYYGLSIKTWWKRKHLSSTAVNEIEQAELRALSKKADDIGIHSPELRKSTIITTTTPCIICAHSIVAHWPKSLITNQDSGHHFTRSGTYEEGEALMRARNIQLIKLAL